MALAKVREPSARNNAIRVDNRSMIKERANQVSLCDVSPLTDLRVVGWIIILYLKHRFSLSKCIHICDFLTCPLQSGSRSKDGMNAPFIRKKTETWESWNSPKGKDWRSHLLPSSELFAQVRLFNSIFKEASRKADVPGCLLSSCWAAFVGTGESPFHWPESTFCSLSLSALSLYIFNSKHFFLF